MDKNFRDVITAAMKEAGGILREKFDSFERSSVTLKSAHEIITENDLLSEKIIVEAIKKNFPEHAILSEEEGSVHNDSDYRWIIDPIDGTTNFSIHNPIWAISVALAHKNEIILGVVYAPILDELFIAEEGNGASKNGLKIAVSKIDSGKVINTFCHGNNMTDIKRGIAYYSKAKLNSVDCRQLGSASLELAYVSSGRVESLVIPGVNAWDVAGGVLLVREAGGRVTDFHGDEWTFESHDIIASNGLVHQRLLNELKEI
ncbi:MAG: inositol monophosphatase family protein [Patescibacteria group bacterium]